MDRMLYASQKAKREMRNGNGTTDGPDLKSSLLSAENALGSTVHPDTPTQFTIHNSQFTIHKTHTKERNRTVCAMTVLFIHPVSCYAMSVSCMSVMHVCHAFYNDHESTNASSHSISISLSLSLSFYSCFCSCVYMCRLLFRMIVHRVGAIEWSGMACQVSLSSIHSIPYHTIPSLPDPNLTLT
jgi:hypothetical protein